MYECLREHPEVFMSDNKEVDFFSHYFPLGRDWYTQQFEGGGTAKAVGEISPDYLYVPDAAGRIKEILPEVRLIVCLRNPIERAYSHCAFHRKKGKHALAFRDALERDSDYVQRGMYADQLDRFLALFAREQILVLIYEDLSPAPEAFLRQVFGFLGVDPDFAPSQAGRRTNRASAQANASRDAFVRLVQAARRNVLLGPLVAALSRTPIVDRVADRMVFGPRREGPDIDPDTHVRLRETFAASNRRLSELLDRDLVSLWT